MNRWTWRIVGILMLLAFLLMFAHLQRRLVDLQQARPAGTERR